MLYVVNYADGEPYESFRKINTRTAYWLGKADKVIEYSRKDIDKEYIDDHKVIFSYKRGAGLWLWKPYLINKALETINYGDWLFYSDAGVTFIRSLHHLIDCANEHSLDVFTIEQPLLCRQFTKRECYHIMGVEDHDENQALGLLLLRKSERSVRFVNEWLVLCEKEELLSPKHFYPEIDEWPDYYAHREDQSILSLLRTKWGLPSFRDCSDYGEMPYMYASPNFSYNPVDYPNSTYPTIILCNRKVHPFMYWIKYIMKRLLSSLGVYYTEKQILRSRKVTKFNSPDE